MNKLSHRCMLSDEKMIKKADQEKWEEKEISVVLDRVVKEVSLKETTFEQNLQGVNPADTWRRVTRRTVSAKALRCLEKSKEYEKSLQNCLVLVDL